MQHHTIIIIIIINNNNSCTTFSYSCSRISDTFSLHAPFVVTARGADVCTLLGLCVADLLSRDPALHSAAQRFLQDATLHSHRSTSLL